MRYAYPQLGRCDWSFLRLDGPGLANCMILVAHAWLWAQRNQVPMIAPTWVHISPGPFLRWERDKRIYNGLFCTREDFIRGWQKFQLLKFAPRSSEEHPAEEGLIVFSQMRGYFESLMDSHREICSLFKTIINPDVLCAVDKHCFENAIAVHIRLGDYSAKARSPLKWYSRVLLEIRKFFPNDPVVVFSDGTDDELAEILKIRNVQRSGLNNALEDMIAISRCRMLIGSDSTFSGWGAYLGQIPCIFEKKHFGRLLIDREKKLVEPDSEKIHHFLEKL